MKPSNFACHPYGSVLENWEAETVATNIMVILERTGNVWRKLGWAEYKKERQNDGNFTTSEKSCFREVKGFCLSAETAVLFAPDWKNAGRKGRKCSPTKAR